MLNQKIIPRNSTIIIGFSGGPDSIYLLHNLKNIQDDLNLTLIAAHLDHEWRPESAQEAVWCQNFCKKYNIPFTSAKASEIDIHIKYNGSKEAYARQLRRTFFAQIKTKYQNAYVALAHHQDDQLETFFIRLARGTSVSGLVGMKEQDNYYLRPLLSITKAAILTYLADNQIPYLQDPSNLDQSYLRNRIRSQLTPQLHTIDKRLPNNIIKVMHHVADVDTLLRDLTRKTLQDITDTKDKSMIKTEAFLALHPILQQRILLELLINVQAHFTPSQGLFAEIIRFLQFNKHHTHTIHQTYKIKKNKNRFYITQQ